MNVHPKHERFFSITLNVVLLFLLVLLVIIKEKRETRRSNVRQWAEASADFSSQSSSITDFFITLEDVFCKTFFIALITFSWEIKRIIIKQWCEALWNQNFSCGGENITLYLCLSIIRTIKHTFRFLHSLVQQFP